MRRPFTGRRVLLRRALASLTGLFGMSIHSRQMIEQSLVHASHVPSAKHRLSRIERRYEQKWVSDAQERCDTLDHRLVRDRLVNSCGDLVAKRLGYVTASQRPMADTRAKSKTWPPEKEGLKRRRPGDGTCKRGPKNDFAGLQSVICDEYTRQFPHPANKIDWSETYSRPMLFDDESTIRRHGQSERIDCPNLVDVIRRRRIDRSLRRHLQRIKNKSFRQIREFADVKLTGGPRFPEAPPLV